MWGRCQQSQGAQTKYFTRQLRMIPYVKDTLSTRRGADSSHRTLDRLRIERTFARNMKKPDGHW